MTGAQLTATNVRSEKPWSQVGTVHAVGRKETLRTGFLAGKDGLLLTAAHLLSERDDVLVEFAAATYQGQVREIHADIAVIKLSGDHQRLPRPLPVSTALTTGHYESWGYREINKGELKLLKATGKIIAILPRDAKSRPCTTLQLDTPTQRPGMSGAPIYSRSARGIIGIGVGRWYSPDPGERENLALAQAIGSLPATLVTSLAPRGRIHMSLFLGVLLALALTLAGAGAAALIVRGVAERSEAYRRTALVYEAKAAKKPYFIHTIVRQVRLSARGPNAVATSTRLSYTLETLRPIARSETVFPESLRANYYVPGTLRAFYGTEREGRELLGSPSFATDYELFFPDLKEGEWRTVITGIDYNIPWPLPAERSYASNRALGPDQDFWAYVNTSDFIGELVISIEADSNIVIRPVRRGGVLFRQDGSVSEQEPSVVDEATDPQDKFSISARWTDLRPGDQAILLYTIKR